MLKLERNAVLGRVVRLDDLDTLGVSTQTLAEQAIAEGRWEEAAALVGYYHDEMLRMHGILTTWIKDILRYIIARTGAPNWGSALPGSGDNVGTPNPSSAAAGIARMLEVYPIGAAPRDRCLESIAERDAAAVVFHLEKMRLEVKNPHDMLVAWIQDMLTYIAQTWGEEAVLDSILQTHQSIWGDRYANWDGMTPHEKLALTVEGMRGGHFSGEGRRGDVSVRDEGDRLVMEMSLCGSGGVLRRGDPETGRGPYPIPSEGVNREPHLWTWQKTGVHWYCSHCAIAMEWLPGRKRRRPLRPLDHVMDPHAPCTWYIYKDEAETRAYHYPRTGLETPADAPASGEAWRAEYPGGSHPAG